MPALIANLLTDLRFALRSLRSTPGFTITALVTLVLGIGATTAIFSVVYAVLFRPLPYHDPQRLVHILADEPSDSRSGLPYSLYAALKGQSASLEHVAIYYRNTGWSRVIAGGRTNPEQVQAGFASAEIFSVLGVSPQLGRAFDASEVRQSAPVAIISHALWLRRFGRNANVLGQSIDVEDKTFTVIGVMPPEFQFPARETQLWLPISTHRDWLNQPVPDDVHARGYFMRWNLVARLRPAATLASAQNELRDLDHRLSQHDRNWNMGLPLKALPVSIEVTEHAKRSLWLLVGAVVLVLLIACANVANLLLARGAARTRELAVRLALGASRTRIVQQILTESIALVLVASAAALLLAGWMIPLLVHWGPPDLPRLDEARLDTTILAFALAAALLTAILFGIGPAFDAARSDPQAGMRSGGGRNFTARHSQASNFLVIAEFAIAIVLTASAGLFLRSLWQAETIHLGFHSDRVLTMRLQYPAALSQSQRSASWDQLSERLRSMSGVENVGGIRNLFELGTPPGNSLRAVEGEPGETNRNRPLTWTTVSGEYFQAMGIPLLAGRLFDDRDRAGSALVAVIDQSMANRYWSGRDPIGRRFKGQDRRGANDDWITVIGVVRDARRQGVEREPTPHVFLFHRQSEPVNDWVIRTSMPPESLIAAVKQAVHEVEPRTVITSIVPIETHLSAQILERRFQTWLIALFAALALTLAAVGIFGVMSNAAARRTHEIGIRLALGAGRGSVVRLILLRGVALATTGLAAGTVLAAAATRLLSTLLFGVTPADPATFVSAVLTLLAVAVVATLIPAWRASGADPLLSLRKD